MSATTTSAVTAARPPAGSEAQAPSLACLVRVELRKAVDTRAGVWLLVIIGLLSGLFVAVRLLVGNRSEKTLDQVLLLAQFPAALLLPVVGILLVTSEFSQRTALTTFSLVPRRGRVIGAKLAAMLVLSLEVALAGLAAAAAGFAIGQALGGVSGGWHLSAALLPQLLLAQCLNMLLGAAFGLVLLNSAAAIVLSFVLPVAWNITSSLISALRTPAEWLDTSRTMAPLMQSAQAMTTRQWEQLGVSLCLWLLLPMAVGLWRLSRKEIS